MAVHAPSVARALVAEAKKGRPADLLLKEARELTDPYHGAWALFHISSHGKMVLPSARAALKEALQLAAAVAEPWRRAELVEDMAGRMASWRGGDDSHGAKAARESVADDWRALAESFPAGAERARAVTAMAPIVPPAALPKLMDAALSHADGSLESGKAVLAAWMTGTPSAAIGPALHSRLRSLQDPLLSGRLFGHLHGQARRARLDPGFDSWAEALRCVTRLQGAPQVELLRYLATVAVDAADLRSLAEASQSLDAESQARVLSTLAGRMDKQGDAGTAREWFERGLSMAAGIGDEVLRGKVEENLRTGMARLGGAPAPTKASKQAAPAQSSPTTAPMTREPKAAPAARAPLSPAPTSSSPVASAAKPDGPAEREPRTLTRPVLAIHNGYDGALKQVHTQAVARAAPLCVGFGLDLALVGFPDDLTTVVAAVERESRIGEGGGYAEQLLNAGRLHWVGKEVHGRPFDWGLGPVVATTQEPDSSKPTDLAAMLKAGPVTIAMGLGHRGLPPQLLRAATHHLELTGTKVPLETATVMGVIAERVRALGAG